MLQHKSDILLLQEARCARHEQRAIEAECMDLGYTLHRDAHSNLAAVTRHGITAIPVANTNAVIDSNTGAVTDAADSDLRVQRLALQTHQYRILLRHVHCASGNSANALNHRRQLFRQFQCETAGDYIIDAGDWNCSPPTDGMTCLLPDTCTIRTNGNGTN